MNDEDKEALKLWKLNINVFNELLTILFFAFKSINERLSKLEVVE